MHRERLVRVPKYLRPPGQERKKRNRQKSV